MLTVVLDNYKFYKHGNNRRWEFKTFWWNGDANGNHPNYNCADGNNIELWWLRTNDYRPKRGYDVAVGWTDKNREHLHQTSAWEFNSWSSGDSWKCAGRPTYRGSQNKKTITFYPTIPRKGGRIVATTDETGPPDRNINAYSSHIVYPIQCASEDVVKACTATTIQYQYTCCNPYGENTIWYLGRYSGRYVHSLGYHNNNWYPLITLSVEKNTKFKGMPFTMVPDGCTEASWVYAYPGYRDYQYGTTTWTNMYGPGLSISRNGTTITVSWSGSGTTNQINNLFGGYSDHNASDAKRVDTLIFRDANGTEIKTVSKNLVYAGSYSFEYSGACSVYGKYTITGLRDAGGNFTTYYQDYGPYSVNAANPELLSVNTINCWTQSCKCSANMSNPNGEDAVIRNVFNGSADANFTQINASNLVRDVHCTINTGRKNSIAISSFKVVAYNDRNNVRVEKEFKYGTSPSPYPAIPLTVSRNRNEVTVSWSGNVTDYPLTFRYGASARNDLCGRTDEFYVYQRDNNSLLFIEKVDFSASGSIVLNSPEPLRIEGWTSTWGLPKYGSPIWETATVEQRIALNTVDRWAPTLKVNRITSASENQVNVNVTVLNPRGENIIIDTRRAPNVVGRWYKYPLAASYLERTFDVPVYVGANCGFQTTIALTNEWMNDYINPIMEQSHKLNIVPTITTYEFPSVTVKRNYDNPSILEIRWTGADGYYPYSELSSGKPNRKDIIEIKDDEGNQSYYNREHDFSTSKGTKPVHLLQHEIYSGGVVKFRFDNYGYSQSNGTERPTFTIPVTEIKFLPAYSVWVKKKGVFKRGTRLWIKRSNSFRVVAKVAVKKNGKFVS